MLVILNKIIKLKWVRLKIKLKIDFYYPFKFKTSSIKSIIPKGVVIGNNIDIGTNVVVSHKLKNIGRQTFIGDNVQLIECVSVGSFTSIAQGVLIGLNNHSLSHIGTRKIFYQPKKGWTKVLSWDEEKEIGYVEIGNDVLISTNVLILGGVKIGNGSVIGAGAVVTKDIPPYSIAVGVPAKIVGKRFSDEICEKLNDSKWWDLSDEEIKKHNEFFQNPIEFVELIKKSHS